MYNFTASLSLPTTTTTTRTKKKKSQSPSAAYRWPTVLCFLSQSLLLLPLAMALFGVWYSQNVELCLMIIMMIWQEVVKTNSLTRISLLRRELEERERELFGTDAF